MDNVKSKAVQIFGQQPAVCAKAQYRDELDDCRECSDLCDPVADMEAECMSECPAYYIEQKLWVLQVWVYCLTAVVVLVILVAIAIALYYRSKNKGLPRTPTKTREFTYTAFNPFDSNAANQRPRQPLLSQSSSSSSVSVCDERQIESRQEPSTSRPNSNRNDLASRPRGDGVVPFGRADCEWKCQKILNNARELKEQNSRQQEEYVD